MANPIWKFLEVTAGSLVESVGGIIDDLNLSKEEKEQFKLQMAEQVRQDRLMTEETIRRELAVTEKVIVSELTQGDVYTKRARPTIVYAGLAFIGLNYVFFPLVYWLISLIAYFLAADVTGIPQPPPLDMPEEFWWMLGSVVSVWSIGRTVERRGVSNAFTDLAQTVGTGKPPRRNSK
jgi:hypothetical protein